MTCYKIIAKLMMYRLRLLNILRSSGHTELVLDVANQYSFITIEISRPGYPFAQLRFEITDESGKVVSAYYEDKWCKTSLMTKFN